MRLVGRYIDTAAQLAGDSRQIADLRRTMRERIASSPLLDHKGFMRALETGYREMWRRWCDAR